MAAKWMCETNVHFSRISEMECYLNVGNASIFLRRCQRTWALASDQIVPLNARNESSGDHPPLRFFLDVASANPSVTSVPSPFRESRPLTVTVSHREDETQSHVTAMLQGGVNSNISFHIPFPGRRQSRHPFFQLAGMGRNPTRSFNIHFFPNIQFPGPCFQTSIFHIHFSRGRNPTSIFHDPSNIHFTSIFLSKMHVFGKLDGSWKMDVWKNGRWKRVSGTNGCGGWRLGSAPPTGSPENGCKMHVGKQPPRNMPLT